MVFVEIVIAFVVLAVAVALRYMLKHRGYIESLGIPYVKPFLIFGSPPFVWHKLLLHEHTQEMHEKLGKTWGKYDGREPTIFTIDPELVKSIMVKNFDSFSEIFDWDIPDRRLTLDLTSGEKWKSLRKVMSPTFTSGKLKSMMAPMDKVVDNLIKHLEKEAAKNPVIPVKEIFQNFALDTISACGFGIDTNSFENGENDILRWGKKLFSSFLLSTWIDSAAFNVFSHFTYLNRYVDFYPSEFDKLFKVTSDIMSERKKMNIVKDDFIGRLAEIIEQQDNVLTPDLITAQGVIFFVAGFETTSNTLATMCYHLAKHQDIQERIFEEIRDCTESSDGEINSETISELHYLEAALNENLRLNGPANDNFRLCSKDIEINGIKFKKGVRVWLPTWASHHNAEFFPDPNTFKSERFLKENASEIIPFTFRPFGGGNRECIGKRFAINEMKISLARMLQKFRIEPAPETKLNFHKGSLFMLNYDPVKVKFVPRDV